MNAPVRLRQRTAALPGAARTRRAPALLAALAIAVPAAVPVAAQAQAQAQPSAAGPAAARAPASALPADPWPRKVDLSNASLLVYQPQITRWDDNQLVFRCAVAIQPVGAKTESFGVLFATARTQVDKVARTVVLEDVKLTQSDFPLLPDRGQAYAAELARRIASDLRTVSLDRMEAALAAAGIKPPPVEVNNDPPQIIVSQRPAILVPVDGAPVFKVPAGQSRFERVINTRALILKAASADEYYLHLYDGWVTAPSLSGPWTTASPRLLVKRALDTIAADLSQKGVVDLLDGGPKADPKPSLAKGAPDVHVTQQPAELVVFEGTPNFVPVGGGGLLWASNTHSDVLVDTASSLYYVLLAGRWFRSPALTGPWTHVAADALPGDFAKIDPASPAAVVLPSVAGTPQAQSALIANSIPQTATVPRTNGPKFTPSFDGAPKYQPIVGTALEYVANSPVPIIRVDASSYFAVSGGVWFTAPAVTGPWAVAAAVPPVVYTIPASSALHYVTYVRIYQATPQVVYVGYTPGYMGTVVSAGGTVVYGTGYGYSPWIGDVWYPAPVTYTVAAAPVYNPVVGFTFGFAVGLAASAWTYPYYGGAWYHPVHWGGYPCCAVASANVYGQWGSTVASGTRSWYGGGGVAGSTASGTYFNQRTGTSGSFDAGRQYNAWTGNATRGYDRTATTAAGGSGQVERAGNYNTYTGQRSTGSAVSAQGAGGSTFERSGATTAGPAGFAHAGSGSTYNARSGQTNTWSSASLGNNHYADVNGNVYRNTGSGWERSGSGGWSGAQASSWADRESQMRSAGADRHGEFASHPAAGGSTGGRQFGGGSRFGGGERFGGGGSFGGRFGGRRR